MLKISHLVKMIGMKTVIGHSYHHSLIEKLQYAMGWKSLLELKGLYYPELVREFYSNMRRKKPAGEDLTIHSMVKTEEGDDTIIKSKRSCNSSNFLFNLGLLLQGAKCVNKIRNCNLEEPLPNIANGAARMNILEVIYIGIASTSAPKKKKEDIPVGVKHYLRQIKNTVNKMQV
ncbi:hypothetical protein COLO4_16088 [Corchorus olitorius]|uniref:Uncharacterized protein n=1 Tax=Corchorus olitorius TaxID=93759 RepID=A0A1R3JJP9_9ROSI|nr:hypothetical protein COLO4_16088 [Corchorus olitorius]